MNTNTEIHIECLGEYISMSTILELAIPNKREREERAWRRRGNKLGICTSVNEWDVRSLGLMPLGTYIGNGYLHVNNRWGWISHDLLKGPNMARGGVNSLFKNSTKTLEQEVSK